MTLTKADVIKMLIISMNELEDFNDKEGDPAVSHGSSAGYSVLATQLMDRYGLTFQDVLEAREIKTAFFDTVNEALEAEGLLAYWPPNATIDYCENFRFVADDGSQNGRQISIFRNSYGRYERPIHYAC